MFQMLSSIRWLLVVSIVSLAAGASTTYSTWNKISPSGPSIGPITGHAGVSEHSGDAALVFGGHNGDISRSTNDVWMFSFHGKTWERVAPTSPNNPPARHDHCGTPCTLESRPHVLFFGGAMANGSLLNDVWALSVGSHYTWRQFTPSSLLRPSPRTHAACACLNASSLIVFGGRGVLGASEELWLMDLVTSTWKKLHSASPMPAPSFGSCFHVLSPSRVFLFGGFNSQNVASNDAWSLDVNFSQQNIVWQYLDSNPNPPARGFHGCLGAPASDHQRLSDIVYIRGGIGSGEARNDNMLQDMWSCSLISKGQVLDFRCRPVFFASPLPLCSQCISVLIANIMLVHGGIGIGGKLSSETKLLFLTDMRIDSVLQPSRFAPAARSGAVMIHFTHLNGKLFLFLHGGSSSDGTLMADTWLFDIALSSWSHSNASGSSSPPARSHACSVLLDHLVVVHGGRCSYDCPTWMFNTVSNQWSPLFSAKTQQPGNIPIPRWGHACLLAATPGITSSLARSMYLIGGISSESNSSLNDIWSLDLDFVQSLREQPSDTTSSESLPQILTLQSHLKQSLRFKLAPYYNSPISTGVVGAPSVFQDSACYMCSFKGPLSSSGFSHSFSIATWLRIVPTNIGKGYSYLIYELQRPFSLDFGAGSQHTLLRLYLKNSRLELVDFNWKICRNCLSSAFRVLQSNFEVSVADGLWHHVAVSVSTDLHKVPDQPHPDLLYLFGTEDCTGPNVSTLVGVDWCDRSDIQEMLERSNSDRVKCIYNPGDPKRVRFSHSCQSSTPSHVSTDQLKNIYSAAPSWDQHYIFDWIPRGVCQGCAQGAHWTIEQNMAFRLPRVTRSWDGNVEQVYEVKFSAVLFCRRVWDQGEHSNWSDGSCTDHPLRGASRVAKIYIDGIEVASGTHFDDPFDPMESGVNLYHSNLRIAYPHVASYLHMNNFPDFNDKLDSKEVGSMAHNYLTMQIAQNSFFLFEISIDLPALIANPSNISATRQPLFNWNFDNSSIFRSNLDTCYRDSAQNNGAEREVFDASLQSFLTSKNLKSRGWRPRSGDDVAVNSRFGRSHMAGDAARTFAYIECNETPCSNSLWTVSLASRSNSWTPLPVVPSPSLLALVSSVPSFQGPTLQCENGRLYIIGGNLRSDSEFTHQSRFTVGTFDLSVDGSQAVFNLFVFHDFSAVVDSASVSNGTHAFIFGGRIGWGRSENSILVLSYTLMQVTKLLPAPPSGPAAFFSGVATMLQEVPNLLQDVNGCPNKPGALIVYGGSLKSDQPGELFRAVSSELYYFDIETLHWIHSETALIVNNLYVNVHTENWPVEPQQRTIALPPLTEHSMISVRTMQGVSVIIIVGGFSKYMSDGRTPDHTTYNRNIYYSFSNGKSWQARGPRSRYLSQSGDSDFLVPPRSAAAVFSFDRMYNEDTLIFIHGGRHWNGVNWANNDNRDYWEWGPHPLLFFNLQQCLIQSSRENVSMFSFEKPCHVIRVFASPAWTGYFHNVIKVPLAGEDRFIVLHSRFNEGGNIILREDLPDEDPEKWRNNFDLSFFTGKDLTMASFHPHELTLQQLERIPNDDIYKLRPPRYPIAQPDHDSSIYENRFLRSAQFAVQYNHEMDVLFVFGGAEVDFTRNDMRNFYSQHDVLWMFKFDKYKTGMTWRKLITIGENPSKRSGSLLVTSGDKLILLGGHSLDPSPQYQQDIFSLSLTLAHPSFCYSPGTYMEVVAGSEILVSLLASTIMKEPALSCESCFSASARNPIDRQFPTFNLLFSAAGINSNEGAALYVSSFVPTVSGLYEINILIQDHKEYRMSYAVIVLPDSTCASTSRLAYGETVVAGSNINFLVSCVDAYHNRRPGGDIISATVRRMRELAGSSGTILEPTFDEFSYEFTDLKSGVYSVEFALTRSSIYAIESKLGIQLIGGKAFTFIVRPKYALCQPPPSSCNTLVIGELGSTFAGQVKPMVVVAFDAFFNLVDASSEVFFASFIDSKDGSTFQDVAVSSRIVQNTSLFSIYFFSSSPGLFLVVTHNGTEVPASNFVRKSMKVDEIIEVLLTNGFNSLVYNDASRVSPSVTDAEKPSIRKFQSHNSSSSSLIKTKQITVENVFKEPETTKTAATAVIITVVSVLSGVVCSTILKWRAFCAIRRVSPEFDDNHGDGQTSSYSDKSSVAPTAEDESQACSSLVDNMDQPDGPAIKDVVPNPDLARPILKMKSSLKSMAKIVHRTLGVKRKVQIVNLKHVISSHHNWRSQSEGYQNLFEFASFMLLFLVVLSLEMNMADSFAVNSMLRSSLQIDASQTSAINTQDDFWNFFEILINNMFRTHWYNGYILTADEEGELSMRSRLLGGLLIIQQRAQTQKGVCTAFASSSYASFVDSCYIDDTVDQSNFTSLDGSVIYSFDFSYGGHSQWFSLSDGPQQSRDAAQHLKTAGFLDRRTKTLFVKFGSMHSPSSLFSFVRIDLTMNSAGVFSDNTVDIQSVRLEPYVLGSNVADRVLLTCEILFLVWLGKLFVDFVWSISQQSLIDGVKAAIGSWAVVDALNLVLMSLFVAFRLRFVLFVANNPLKVPTNRYPAIIEEAATLNRNQVTVSFFNIAVALVRLFKFYRFQGRLDILNKTFIAAFENMYHYLAIFLVVFGGYAAMGHFLFGTNIESFSSISRSLLACLQMAVGEIGLFPDMVNAAPNIASVYFVSFVFLVVFVLFNVLLAIIVDAYQQAASEATESSSMAQDAAEALKRLAYKMTICSGQQTVSSKRLLVAATALIRQGKTEVSISDLAQACGVDSIRAIYRNPDVASIREVESTDEDISMSNSIHDGADSKSKLITGGSTLLL